MSEAVAAGAGPRVGLPRVLPDERLVRRAVKGDERAFAAIFDRYHQRLYRYCLALVGNPQDAQDALQNTMVKVLRALPGEGRQIELKPWLYRIAHNESIELLRRRRETRELDAELAAPGVGLTEEVVSRERLRQLISDLEELPERQRGALVMRELSGLEFAEIGTALGTSPAVARQTLYEARLSLRQMDEGREMSCEAVMKALSDGDGRVSRRRDLRAHLRTCADCRRFSEEIEARERDLGALAPLPAVAAAGLLNGLFGGGGAAGGSGGLAAGIGGGAAKSIGASALLKGAAAVVVVAAIGVGVADRGRLIGPGSTEGGAPAPTRPERSAAADQGRNPGVLGPAASGRAAQKRAARVRIAAARARSVDAARGSESGAVGAPGAGPGPGAGQAEPGGRGAPQTRGGSTSHPHGRGHEKQHPAPAAHGQQTAAGHKAGHASTGSGGHPVHPEHPAKPAPPPHPAAAQEKRPPSATASPAPPQEEEAAPTAPAEAESSPAETGKKP